MSFKEKRPAVKKRPIKKDIRRGFESLKKPFPEPIFLANMPETPRLLSLGMNGILSKLRQVEPGEAEQIPT